MVSAYDFTTVFFNHYLSLTSIILISCNITATLMFGSSVSLFPDGTTRPICLLNTSGKFDFKLDHPSRYSMSSGFIQEERRTYFRTVCFEMLSRSYCKGIFTADQIKTELEKSPPMLSLAIRSLFGAVGMKVISENQFIHVQKNKKKKKRNRAAIQVSRKECNEDGCTNKVRAKGFCGNHGICYVNDCTNKVKGKGLCEEHGTCSEVGCTCQVVAKGFCGNHGTCSVDDCTNKVKGRGLCEEHGECSKVGCTCQVVAGGLCGKHKNGECNEDGCTNNAVAKGFCGKHGICSVDDCTNKVKGKGLCEEHGTCNEDGCTYQVVAGGFCGKHRR
jgi:uncharacterized protein YneF (UPF0154 family)